MSESSAAHGPEASPRVEAERVIVALDRPTTADNVRLIDELDGVACWYKLGMEAYYRDARAMVAAIQRAGASLFLDLKLHDIPNTVRGATRSLSSIGADLMTVHALGGGAMIEAAREGLAGTEARLLAVTILTSHDEATVSTLGIEGGVRQAVLRLAELALSHGAHGLVCSPLEVGELRRRFPEALLVCPGVRPLGSASDDQVRVATASRAVADGASWIVVGRPIHRSSDPKRAFLSIAEESLTGATSEVAAL